MAPPKRKKRATHKLGMKRPASDMEGSEPDETGYTTTATDAGQTRPTSSSAVAVDAPHIRSTDHVNKTVESGQTHWTGVVHPQSRASDDFYETLPGYGYVVRGDKFARDRAEYRHLKENNLDLESSMTQIVLSHPDALILRDNPQARQAFLSAGLAAAKIALSAAGNNFKKDDKGADSGDAGCPPVATTSDQTGAQHGAPIRSTDPTQSGTVSSVVMSIEDLRREFIIQLSSKNEPRLRDKEFRATAIAEAKKVVFTEFVKHGINEVSQHRLDIAADRHLWNTYLGHDDLFPFGFMTNPEPFGPGQQILACRNYSDYLCNEKIDLEMTGNARNRWSKYVTEFREGCPATQRIFSAWQSGQSLSDGGSDDFVKLSALWEALHEGNHAEPILSEFGIFELPMTSKMLIVTSFTETIGWIHPFLPPGIRFFYTKDDPAFKPPTVMKMKLRLKKGTHLNDGTLICFLETWELLRGFWVQAHMAASLWDGGLDTEKLEGMRTRLFTNLLRNHDLRLRKLVAVNAAESQTLEDIWKGESKDETERL